MRRETSAFGEVAAVVVEPHRHTDVVQVERFGSLVEQHAFRATGGTARVHEHDRIVLVGLVGFDGATDAISPRTSCRGARRHRPSTRCDAAATRRALRRCCARDGRRTTCRRRRPHTRVGEDELQLLPREAKVERVDHAGSQEPGVIQLEVLVAVRRHDGEAIARAEAQLVAHRITQAEYPLAVLGEGGVVVAVVEADLGPRTAPWRAGSCGGRRVPSWDDPEPLGDVPVGAFASTETPESGFEWT